MPAPPHLVQGDILLYRSRSLVGRAIRLFDGSPVNHAGLYLGNDRVGEALAGGLVNQAFDESLSGNEWVTYHRLTPVRASMWPVVARAGHYLQRRERYAYEQLLLLAVLSIGRRVPVNRVLAWLVRRVLDTAADLLLSLGPTRGEPLICSEFVHRCFEEAETTDADAHSYALFGGASVRGRPGASSPRDPIRSPGLRRSSRERLRVGSLLAWYDGSPVPVSRPAPERRWTALGAESDGIDDDMPADLAGLDLEGLISAYLDEVEREAERNDGRERPASARVESVASRDPSLRTPEMRARIRRFVAAWADATAAAADLEALAPTVPQAAHATIGDARPAMAAGRVRIETPERALADFVTPGDLWRCRTLEGVGRWDE